MKKNTNMHENEERWSIIILRRELAQLQREQEHLRLKNIERALTPWERLRMAESMDEMMELLSQFSKNKFNASLDQDSDSDTDFDPREEHKPLELAAHE